MATQVLIPREYPDLEREILALRQRLRPLLPAVADICGTESVQYRLLRRALLDPPLDPEVEARRLRLASFSLEEAPGWAQRAIAAWSGDTWREAWARDA